MEVYLVGGAVRDELLGRPVLERDWVVVGATPETMERAGYRPVGRDFPVFLHPETGEEYALARTERKTARGYRGFKVHASPEVTLEQDLLRRDLTVNAIAKDGTVPFLNVAAPLNAAGEPAAALGVTVAFCLVASMIGSLDLVAPLLDHARRRGADVDGGAAPEVGRVAQVDARGLAEDHRAAHLG